MGAMTRGLGRGLDALLGSYSEDISAPEVMLLPISIIKANPNQPRKRFNDESLSELADSIRVSGLLQPIMVRPVRDSEEREYELVAGERRLRAGKLAGLEEVPAIVRELSDDESLVFALIENLQREDLNAIEEAQGLASLRDQLGLSQEELADKVGKSRPAVANSLRLLQLPEIIQEDLQSGALTAGHGRALLAVDDDKAMLRLREGIISNGLSVREAEAAAAYFKRTGALPGETRKKSTRGRGAQAADPVLSRLEIELNQSLEFKISVKGDIAKGKIIFGYSDKEQLLALMAAFGKENEARSILEETAE